MRKLALIAVAACLAAPVAGCTQQRPAGPVAKVATTTADSTRTVTKTPEATGIPLTR